LRHPVDLHKGITPRGESKPVNVAERAGPLTPDTSMWSTFAGNVALPRGMIELRQVGRDAARAQRISSTEYVLSSSLRASGMEFEFSANPRFE
jgi:hypothetical protein